MQGCAFFFLLLTGGQSAPAEGGCGLGGVCALHKLSYSKPMLRNGFAAPFYVENQIF